MSLETLRLCQEGSVILLLPRFNKEVKSRFKFLPFPCPSTIAPASQPISKVWERHCRKVSCQFKVRRGVAEQPSLLHLHGLKAKDAFWQWPLLPGQCSCHTTHALCMRKKGTRERRQVSFLPHTPQQRYLWKNCFSFPERGKKGWQGLVFFTAKVFAVTSSCRGGKDGNKTY